MNIFIIIICVAVIAVAVLYFSAKNAQEIKEEKPKFQPRKVTYTIGVDPYEQAPPKKNVIDSMDKPKRKKKKYYNKKKPAVAQNETVEKRPVGRPKKSN
jgi:hypothetical protein